MTISVITQQAATEGAVLMRYRGKSATTGNHEYDVKPLFTGKKKGWMIMDAFTASSVQAVYKSINEENRARFDRIHISRLLPFVWKSVQV